MRLILAAIGVLTLLLFAFFELVLSDPVAWYLYALLAIVFAAAWVRRTPLRSQKFELKTLCVLYAMMTALYLVDLTSRKPFLRDLYSIRIGMTESEVRDIMTGYIEGTGWESPYHTAGTLSTVGSGTQYQTGISPTGELTIRDSLVFRHAETGEFNSDWGIVTLSNGRVVVVEFSPD